jgi:hypothetical protein
MKFKFIYVLPFLIAVVFATGCAKTPKIASTPTNTPSGTFNGQFLYIHINSKTNAADTQKANLQLTMSTATGFAITGDTATVHAGSHGAYIINSFFTGIDFIDVTNPASGTPAKHHLNGIYQYTYNGDTLKILAYGAADTTAAFYTFVRQQN